MRVLPPRWRSILFTGATASVKGYPQSASFAMSKFDLRGLDDNRLSDRGTDALLE